MRFKLDENMPVELANDLRIAGHDVHTVADEGLKGAEDPPILRRVAAERRILRTMDKGIADIRAYPPEEFAGLVLFRLKRTGRRSVLTFVRQNLPQILQTELSGRLLVVTENGMRLR